VDYIITFKEIKKLNFISNGTVIPTKNFSNLKNFSKYYVSLESWIEKDNDKIRGDGVFKKVLKNIEILKNMGYKIGIMTTLLNSNINNLITNFNQLETFLKDNGVDEIIFERFIPVGKAKFLKTEVVDNFTILKFYKTISQYYELDFDEIKKYKAIKISFSNKDKFFSIPQFYGAQCTSGKEGVAVLCDGTVYPCRRMGLPIGNLLKNNLADLIPCDKIFNQITNKDIFNCYAMSKNFL
jgi:MoaA/NifB/PqqE/SkfB family radical SAM enzyme